MSRNIVFVGLGGLVGCVARYMIVALSADLIPGGIPLGTFLAMGGAVAHAWGPQIIRWYIARVLGGA